MVLNDHDTVMSYLLFRVVGWVAVLSENKAISALKLKLELELS